MTSRSKAAGTRWESLVVDFLKGWWGEISRTPLTGRYDKGDLKYGPAGWTIECKNQAVINLPLFMRQTVKEMANNGHTRCVCIVKNRRGKYTSGATRDAYAVMPLQIWADVAKENELLGQLVQRGQE